MMPAFANDTFAKADPDLPKRMQPEEFIMWLNGALDLLSATPPTAEQWELVRDKMQEQVGAVVVKRMHDSAAEAKQVELAIKAQQSYTAVISKHNAQLAAYKQSVAIAQSAIQDYKKPEFGVISVDCAPDTKPTLYDKLKNFVTNS